MDYSSSQPKSLSEEEPDRLIVDLLRSMTQEQLKKAYELCKQEREKAKAHTKDKFVQAM